MAIGNVIAFIKTLGRDETLKETFGRVRSDEEIEKIAGKAGFDFSAEEFFSVVNDLPEGDRKVILEDLLKNDASRRAFFCEDCGDKGSSFCLTVCFWIKI